MKLLSLSVVLVASALFAGACSDATTPEPLDRTAATFELERIDGLAFGTTPFASYSGIRDLDHGAWSETWTYSAGDVTRTLLDGGTYSVDGDEVLFFSNRTNNEHVGTLDGDRMVIHPGTLTYTWRRVR